MSVYTLLHYYITINTSDLSLL